MVMTMMIVVVVVVVVVVVQVLRLILLRHVETYDNSWGGVRACLRAVLPVHLRKSLAMQLCRRCTFAEMLSGAR